MLHFKILPTDNRWKELLPIQKLALAESLVNTPTHDAIFQNAVEKEKNKKYLIKGNTAETLKNLGFPIEEINAELMGEEINRNPEEVFHENTKDRSNGILVENHKLDFDLMSKLLNKKEVVNE